MKLRWAEPSSRFTARMARLVIDWLRAASQKAVGEQLGLSWDEVHGIMERAVERGLERRQAEPLPQLGIDEKAFRKGHKYFTLVMTCSGLVCCTWPRIEPKPVWMDSGRR